VAVVSASGNHIGQEAAEHAGIHQPSIHPLPPRRTVDMSGIAYQQEAPTAVLICHAVVQTEAGTPVYA
jgi:hypothetical protein